MISGTRSLMVMLSIQRCGMSLAQQTLSGWSTVVEKTKVRVPLSASMMPKKAVIFVFE
ncbi:hypothetical protein [Streptomyces antimycoticus]|uniref:hypothetical protein n=1 Tax=Streptomyces antimycoticus TaxID=68175 RepID=UPI0036EE67AD